MMTIFEEQKKKALERLRIKGADEEVVEIIGVLNRLDYYYTTSSCSGRVALICIPEIGAKREAEFIGKWHRAVTKEEVSEAIKAPKKGGDMANIAVADIARLVQRFREGEGIVKDSDRIGL